MFGFLCGWLSSSGPCVVLPLDSGPGGGWRRSWCLFPARPHPAGRLSVQAVPAGAS